MRATATIALGIGVTLTLMSACRDPGGGLDVSWFRANVRGVHEVSYVGSGDFTVGAGHDGLARFILNSNGLDASVGQRLVFFRRGEGRPAEGTHVLGPLEERDGVRVGFAAYYYREDGGLFEAFTASSGVLRITKSTEDMVAGSFQFAGVLYCASPAVDDFTTAYTCGDPNTLDLTAPQVDVIGTFMAEPFEVGRITLD
jgi:hypothetical protein